MTQGQIGLNKSSDPSKLFPSHVGTKLFDVNLSFSLVDSNIVDELRTLEAFNEKGFTIVLRPSHHDLPPVLLGNYSMTQSNPTFDYHYSNIVINFKETVISTQQVPSGFVETLDTIIDQISDPDELIDQISDPDIIVEVL